MTPTLGGYALFGVAVNVNMNPNANAYQLASFFGVQGVQGMDGGQRGRVFEITGVLVGETPAYVVAGATQLSSYADGVARIFQDTTGTAWPNVVYRNEFQWTGKFMEALNLGGWCRPYRCVLHGLT